MRATRGSARNRDFGLGSRLTVVLDEPERSEESHCGGCEIVAYRDPPQAENLACEILCSGGQRCGVVFWAVACAVFCSRGCRLVLGSVWCRELDLISQKK